MIKMTTVLLATAAIGCGQMDSTSAGSMGHESSTGTDAWSGGNGGAPRQDAGQWTGGTDGTDGADGDGPFDGTDGTDGTDGFGGVDQPEPQPPAQPDPGSGDQYAKPIINPFVMTEADPFSTFAADVDTASYDIFRRDIDWFGTLPHPWSVRTEEYVNAFRYGYEAPPADGVTPFAIHLDAAPSPMADGATILRVGIKGRELSDLDEKPANLVFLIDVSGSMSSGNKLNLVKTVLNASLDALAPTDTISIVTYAGSTGVALPPTPVSQKATISAKINSFTSGGSTAGASGINLAYQQAEAGFIEGGINHVLLLTDGDFNVGISGTDALVDLIEEKRQSGVTLTVLGFGAGNLNDEMMEKITNAGNGIYAMISNADQAVQYASERLLTDMTYIAQDLKFQVVFNESLVTAYRLIGYENRAIEDHLFEDDTVDAGEVGAGHTVTALYELILAEQSVPETDGCRALTAPTTLQDEVDVMPEELVRVKIRYKTPGAAQDDPAFEVASSLLPEDLADGAEMMDADFQWAVAVAALAEVLRESPFGTDVDLDAVTAALNASAGTAPDRLELVAMTEVAIPLAKVKQTDTSTWGGLCDDGTGNLQTVTAP